VADEEQDAAPKSRRGAAARADTAQAGTPERRAVDAYNEYVSSLADLWASTDPTDRARQAYADYVSRVGEDWTTERMAQRYADASRLYVQLMDAYLDPEQDQLEAYRSYLTSVAEQLNPREMHDRARKAYTDYLDEYGAALAPDELERRAREAWQAYIGKLKEVCSQLDPEGDPAAVSMLGQSAQAAAAAAASVRQVVDRRRAALESVAAARPE
jgi:hypothetical protein